MEPASFTRVLNLYLEITAECLNFAVLLTSTLSTVLSSTDLSALQGGGQVYGDSGRYLGEKSAAALPLYIYVKNID